MAFQLPRMPAGGFASLTPELQQIWWQQVVEAIEGQENSQNDQIAAIQALQADMLAVQNDLVAQLALINAAQATAETAQTNDAISGSATQPTTVLSSSDGGTDATITVAAHNRIYGDGSVLAIAGPTDITGLAYGTLYAVYYDDATRSDTTPAYVATTVLADAQPNKAPGRHFVGQVTTATAGGGSTSGDGPRPPGGGGPYP